MAWFVCILLLLIGFVLLVKGADFFVDGAAGIAEKLKVSTFIIGMTIVALGTSAPEAAVSIISAVSGEGEVIMGNVLGSNLINILLILGISALISFIPVEKRSRVFDLPFLIITSILFLFLGDLGGGFAWYDGLILLALYGVFMTYTIILAKRQTGSICSLSEDACTTVIQTDEKKSGLKGFIQGISAKYQKLKEEKVWFLILITIVGLGMVIGGAELVVQSATYIAQDLLRIPTGIVALTVVAFGTSLPELVTSVTAAKKGDMGLATGNIIGSNIANILLVARLGFISSGNNVVAFDTSSLLDGYASVIAAVLLLIFGFCNKKRLGKVAGSVFLFCLIAFFTYRILATVGIVPLITIPTIF